MRYEKALERVNDLLKYAAFTFEEDDLDANDTIAMHMACKSALEKQIPQKPIGDCVFYLNELYCPSCRKFLGFPHNAHPNFCGKCGQALDWRD